MTPRLDCLPAAQRRFWPELEATPKDFILYGGTAIALRLGHRVSIDFDFFSDQSFSPEVLQRSIPYLDGAVLRQAAPNTLTVTIERGGPVQLSFFGGLSLGRVQAAEIVEGPGIQIASTMDLAGTKVAVVTQRAEKKDYLDIHALMTKAGISLSSMLSAARHIYGEAFQPLLALKAISYHQDPEMNSLPLLVRKTLIEAVDAVDLRRLPTLPAFQSRLSR